MTLLILSHLQEPTLQRHAQEVEHAVSDSVARAAALGETWQPWRIAIALVLVLAAIGVLAMYWFEFRSVRAAGGIKAYTKDFDSVNYGAVRGIWTSEIIVILITFAILLHAFTPKLVSELQIEAVVTLFGFVGLFRGINFGAFFAKRATETPAHLATRAAIADPNLQPVVTQTKNGETIVSSVPVVQPPVTATETRVDTGATSVETRTESAPAPIGPLTQQLERERLERAVAKPLVADD